MVMKYGACQRGQGTIYRCRQPATHLVSWQTTHATSQGESFPFDEYRCEPDARALMDRLEASGKKAKIEALDLHWQPTRSTNMSLDSLKLQAVQAADKHGHQMGPWLVGPNTKETAHSNCTRPSCFGYLEVTSKAAPSGDYIIGSALTLACATRPRP
jgi:hypothetical protein